MNWPVLKTRLIYIYIYIYSTLYIERRQNHAQQNSSVSSPELSLHQNRFDRYLPPFRAWNLHLALAVLFAWRWNLLPSGPQIRNHDNKCIATCARKFLLVARPHSIWEARLWNVSSVTWLELYTAHTASPMVQTRYLRANIHNHMRQSTATADCRSQVHEVSGQGQIMLLVQMDKIQCCQESQQSSSGETKQFTFEASRANIGDYQWSS